MQQSIEFTDVWHIMWFVPVLWLDIIHTKFGFLVVLWFDISHTQKHTAHTGANRLTHPYKYISTPSVMRSQQLCVFHRMNNFLIQKFTLQNSTMPLLFKNYSLVEVTYLSNFLELFCFELTKFGWVAQKCPGISKNRKEII